MDEVFPTERLKKIWEWRQGKTPVPFSQISLWVGASKARVHQLYVKCQFWQKIYDKGARIGGIDNRKLAKILLKNSLRNRDQIVKAVQAGTLFPVKTKGLMMVDYVTICKWAGVEPHRPDIVAAWQRVKENEKALKQSQQALNNTEKRYE